MGLFTVSKTRLAVRTFAAANDIVLTKRAEKMLSRAVKADAHGYMTLKLTEKHSVDIPDVYKRLFDGHVRGDLKIGGGKLTSIRPEFSKGSKAVIDIFAREEDPLEVINSALQASLLLNQAVEIFDDVLCKTGGVTFHPAREMKLALDAAKDALPRGKAFRFFKDAVRSENTFDLQYGLRAMANELGVAGQALGQELTEKLYGLAVTKEGWAEFEHPFFGLTAAVKGAKGNLTSEDAVKLYSKVLEMKDAHPMDIRNAFAQFTGALTAAREVSLSNDQIYKFFDRSVEKTDPVLLGDVLRESAAFFRDLKGVLDAEQLLFLADKIVDETGFDAKHVFKAVNNGLFTSLRAYKDREKALKTVVGIIETTQETASVALRAVPGRIAELADL